jgi:serine/threonine-protein kinase
MGSLHDVDVGVREGDVLAGKYRVERILGSGGMGVVVAAHHLQLDEKVALKFLLPDALKVPEYVGRFEREAKAAVKIKSEHVARVVDVGRLETGSPYMVMEYLEGGDLAGVLEKQGRLPIEQAVDFVLQACEAIAEAHSIGIVHRDLKPSNLFCTRRPDGQLSIKVLDFGISKVVGAPGSTSEMSMTRTTSVMGSPVYMSPEQMQTAKGVDHRTDVWSLGVILYELLTGEVPFDSASVTDLAIRVATEPPPPVSRHRADIPAGLEKAILRCLEKTRVSRFQNVAELAAAIAPFGSRHAHGSLERIQGTLQPVLAPTELAERTTPSPSASTQGSWQTSGAGPKLARRRGKTALAIVGVAVAALLVAGGVIVLGRRSTQAVTTGAPGAGSALAAAQAQPPVPPSTQPSAQVPATVESPPAASASTAPPLVPSIAPARLTAPQRPPPVSHGATPPQAKPRCDPPYYFDAQGNRVFKKECL